MAEIIARFADGRLLVHEDRVLDTQYISGGIAVRIGLVRTVEKVLSIDTKISGYPGQNVAAPLNEVTISDDTITPLLRRGDMPTISGCVLSGMGAPSMLSGITSGLTFGAQLASGCMNSGKLAILANVIGY